MSSILDARHIRKKFKNLEVLKDVSLSVNSGEAAVIVGPSGAD